METLDLVSVLRKSSDLWETNTPRKRLILRLMTFFDDFCCSVGLWFAISSVYNQGLLDGYSLLSGRSHKNVRTNGAFDVAPLVSC